MRMDSVNVAILGDQSIAQELGKKGSSTDMTFYDRKSGGKIFTFIAPSGFPEKIQPLIQAIALSEYAVLNVSSLDKSLGEQIVALDSMGVEKGFIVAEGLEDDLKKFIKSTTLEKFEFISKSDIVPKIESLSAAKVEGSSKMIIDAAFEVKGVGTVALGVVRRGTIKKHDEMEIAPSGKQISVRSIQMHDDDVDVVESPGRAGLSLKGCDAKDISRGDVVTQKGALKSSSSLKIKFEKSRFYKEEVTAQSSYHLCIGLQIRPVKIEMKEGMQITSEKPFAYDTGEGCVVLDLNSKSTRIVGKGSVL